MTADALFDAFLDSLIDTGKLIPFLFLTYLLMEYLEHHAGEKTRRWIAGSGRKGPLLGALAGLLPQCGFSAAASNLYAARLITRGTLIAVFLSTSDEMLPVLLSESAEFSEIGKLLGIKFLIGMTAGFLIDVIHQLGHHHGETEEPCIHEICEQEHCHCSGSLVQSALGHTLKIGLFLLAAALVLNLSISWIGEDTLMELIQSKKVLSIFLSAALGLIPNCAPSVLLTHLYLSKTLGLGAAMAGLLVNAGVGTLVLFRMNEHGRENFSILGTLYLIGILAGSALTWLVG